MLQAQIIYYISFNVHVYTINRLYVNSCLDKQIFTGDFINDNITQFQYPADKMKLILEIVKNTNIYFHIDMSVL